MNSSSDTDPLVLAIIIVCILIGVVLVLIGITYLVMKCLRERKDRELKDALSKARAAQVNGVP